MKFEQKFDDEEVMPSGCIRTQCEGYTFTTYIEQDCDIHIDDDDFHNPDQSVTGCDDEQQKRLLEAREAWLRNEWFYCGLVITASRNGILLTDNAASLWGLECNYPNSNNAHLTEVANELLPEALKQARIAHADMLVKLAL